MNKEAFLLGYTRQPEANISKVAFQQAYMNKNAGWAWPTLSALGTGGKFLWEKGQEKIEQYATQKAMKKMMPLAFGGAALLGGAAMMFGSGGKQNPSAVQTVAGNQGRPQNILPQQQGNMQSLKPDEMG